MTYLDHIDDLDILQEPIHCAVQRIQSGATGWVGETVVTYKHITIKSQLSIFF